MKLFYTCKYIKILLTIFLIFCVSNIFPQAETGSSNKSGNALDGLTLHLGVTPDIEGNVALDTRFSYQYWKFLSAGFSYVKNQRSEVVEDGLKRVLDLICKKAP